jgi:hypothetical protein
MARADMRDGSLAMLSASCTGDRDAEQRARHAASVKLLRPGQAQAQSGLHCGLDGGPGRFRAAAHAL